MCTLDSVASRHAVNITYRYPPVTHCESSQSDPEEEEVLKPHRTLFLGTIVLVFLLQIKLGYALAAYPSWYTMPPPVVPPGFVEVKGPHGIAVLVGPLQPSPTGGWEREVILPGQPPFMISTEPGVTPQDIADVYG
jgi:hypothetical protein